MPKKLLLFLFSQSLDLNKQLPARNMLIFSPLLILSKQFFLTETKLNSLMAENQQ